MSNPKNLDKLNTALTKAVEAITKKEVQEETRKANIRERPCHGRFKPGYIVRIELHQIKDSGRYRDLHAYLKDMGFSNVIISDENVDFQLPSATYYVEDSSTRLTYKEVYGRAERGVRAALEGVFIDVKDANTYPTVLVTKTDKVYWSGLEAPAKPTE